MKFAILVLHSIILFTLVTLGTVGAMSGLNYLLDMPHGMHPVLAWPGSIACFGMALLATNALADAV